jgi:hypothetical protein
MSEFDPRRDSMRKMTLVVAAALALGTATMATGTAAFGRGGGGGGGGHFGGGGGGHFGGGGGHFGGAHFAGGFGRGHFGRGFRGGLGRLYGFGGAFPLTATTTAMATTVVTPSRPTATLGSATEIGWCPLVAPSHRTF